MIEEALFSRMTGPFSIPEGPAGYIRSSLLSPFYFVSFRFVLTALFRSFVHILVSDLSFHPREEHERAAR